jgi:hypothetical protein
MEENLKLDRQNANTQRLAKIMQLLKKLKSPSKISGKFKKERENNNTSTVKLCHMFVPVTSQGLDF